MSDSHNFVFPCEKTFLIIEIYFLINVYSDLSQIALKYSKDTEANINNILVMVGDFHIRDNSWNPSFSHHSIHHNLLTDIADSMSLCISKSTNQVPTRYSDNQNDSNLVINLMFLWLISSEFDNYTICPEWRLLSDHTSLTVNIVIIEEHIQIKKCTIVKNSKEEKNFLAKFIESIKGLNIEHISSKENLEWIVQEFVDNIEKIWFRYSKIINITKHSKSWRNKEC